MSTTQRFNQSNCRTLGAFSGGQNTFSKRLFNINYISVVHTMFVTYVSTTLLARKRTFGSKQYDTILTSGTATAVTGS